LHTAASLSPRSGYLDGAIFEASRTGRHRRRSQLSGCFELRGSLVRTVVSPWKLQFHITDCSGTARTNGLECACKRDIVMPAMLLALTFGGQRIAGLRIGTAREDQDSRNGTNVV
jgi:hypothetical protein